MKVIASYLTIPVLFSLVVATFAIATGMHNQATFISLFFYGLFFYGVPFYVLASVLFLAKPPNLIMHSGFLGVTLSLALIESLWLLPSDPSGLPIQWMGYWPLSGVLSLVFMGGTFAYKKYYNS